MLFRLTNSAPWGDEWVEWFVSRTPFRDLQMYNRIITTFQPPLYNALMHIWLSPLQSFSLLWFRLFNVVIGSVSGYFLFSSIKKLYHVPAACVALCSLAACHEWVYCIQECSEYALMLMFLFAALYFYIKVASFFSWRAVVAFLLSCVGAAYSQYGSVFVILPLALLFYFRTILEKEIPRKKKIIVTLLYAGCVLAFAAPLYIFYVKAQLAHNEIAGHTETFTFSLLSQFHLVMGNMIKYLLHWNAETQDAWRFFWDFLSVILIAAVIFLIVMGIKGKFSRVKLDILITLLSAYVLFYLLVQLHIYAMLHPGESLGFYSRYSYFYIPIFSVALPVAILELYRLIPSTFRKTAPAAAGMCLLILYFSFFNLLGNWHKSYDDQFAEIWMANQGWESPTYVLGVNYGFQYYVPHSDGYQDGYLDKVSYASQLDPAQLPERFWVWRINWGGDDWKKMVDLARGSGYTVTVYRDSGHRGQLAFCSK